MNIKAPKGTSLVGHLTNLLMATFPQQLVTGKANDMRRIRPDPILKGKGVRFFWHKEEYRLTANGKVKWLMWGSNYPRHLAYNDDCETLERGILNALSPAAHADAVLAPTETIMEIAPTATEIAENKATVAATELV
jgi:hypothetical protein